MSKLKIADYIYYSKPVDPKSAEQPPPIASSYWGIQNWKSQT